MYLSIDGRGEDKIEATPHLNPLLHFVVTSVEPGRILQDESHKGRGNITPIYATW
jgi:hypothetical protein